MVKSLLFLVHLVSESHLELDARIALILIKLKSLNVILILSISKIHEITRATNSLSIFILFLNSPLCYVVCVKVETE